MTPTGASLPVASLPVVIVPLGTDEEAAGTPVPPEAVAEARRYELRHAAAPHKAEERGYSFWILVGIAIISAVAETHEKVLVTKRGIPLAYVVPYDEKEEKKPIPGKLADTVLHIGDIETPCGPDIREAHTPNEHVSVGSVANFWKFMVRIAETV